MKKLLIILSLALCSKFALSQVPQPPYNIMTAPSYEFRKYVLVDSMLFLGVRDTLIRPIRAGATVVWQHAGVDTVLWLFDGLKWVKQGSGGSGGSQGWQDVLTVDPDLTTNNTSNVNGHNFIMDSLGDFRISQGKRDQTGTGADFIIHNNQATVYSHNALGYSDAYATQDRAGLHSESSGDSTDIRITPTLIAIKGPLDSSVDYPSSLVGLNSEHEWKEYSPSLFAVNTTFNGCVEGCIVTWDTLYTYIISPSKYYINGKFYQSPADTVTLSAADPTNNRIDVFVVDTLNANDLVEGVAANPALQPDIDELSQLQISFATIYAGTTSPTNIDTVVIYKENLGLPTEFTYADNTVNLNPNSPNNPYQGVKDIEGTNVAANNASTFTYSSAVDFTRVSLLTLKIRLKAGFVQTLTLRWQNGTTVVGTTLTLGNGLFGLDATNTTSYQNIAIPLSYFGNITGANVLRIAKAGATTVGFYIDNIILMSGILPPPPPPSLNVTATSPITATTTGSTVNISTLMNTSKLIGRYSAGTGVMQEINISTGLALDGSGNLTATPYSRSISGITTASATPQYSQGQKGFFSNTDTIVSYYGGEILRSALYKTGIQGWALYNGAAEAGFASITTPIGLPGLVFSNTLGEGRSQIRQYVDSGGISLGAEDSSLILAGNQFVMLDNGHTFITGYTPTTETRVPDSGYLFNVFGTSFLWGKLYLGTLSNGTGSDSVLVINAGEVKKVSPSAFGGSGFTTANNGLTASTATNVQFGGTLIKNTDFNMADFAMTFHDASNLTFSSNDTILFDAVHSYTLTSLDSGYVLAANLLAKGTTAKYLASTTAGWGYASSTAVTKGFTATSSGTALVGGAFSAAATNKVAFIDTTSGLISWGKVAASDIGSGAALTKTDDTNVTLTLGGSPSTSLLAATSLTLGWTGALSLARGGTNNGSLSATNGGLPYMDGTKMTTLAIGTTGQHLVVVGGVPVWRDTAAAGGALSLTAIGSSPNANGATLTGSVLNLEPASISFGGVVTTGTQTFSGIKTIDKSNFGITSTNGLTLTNSTAATNVLDQWSPSLILHGSAWKSNATAATNTFDWIIQGKNLQGTSAVSSTLSFDASFNGAAQSNIMTLGSNGLLTVTQANTVVTNATTSVTTPLFPVPSGSTWSFGSSTNSTVRIFAQVAASSAGGDMQIAHNSQAFVANTGYTLDAYGEGAFSGGVNIRSLSAGSFTLSTVGVAGSTSITYAVTARLLNGQTVYCGSQTINTANATLSTSNYVQITMSPVVGVYQYDLYRVSTNGTSPSAGQVGKISSNQTPGSIQDKGTTTGVGDGTTANQVNTTSVINVKILRQTTMTTAQRTGYTATEGDQVYDSDTHKSYTWDGSAWQAHF